MTLEIDDVVNGLVQQAREASPTYERFYRLCELAHARNHPRTVDWLCERFMKYSCTQTLLEMDRVHSTLH